MCACAWSVDVRGSAGSLWGVRRAVPAREGLHLPMGIMLSTLPGVVEVLLHPLPSRFQPNQRCQAKGCTWMYSTHTRLMLPMKRPRVCHPLQKWQKTIVKPILVTRSTVPQQRGCIFPMCLNIHIKDEVCQADGNILWCRIWKLPTNLWS